MKNQNKSVPVPSSCVTYRQNESGEMVVVSTETREPIKHVSGWEPEVTRHSYHVVDDVLVGGERFSLRVNQMGEVC